MKILRIICLICSFISSLKIYAGKEYYDSKNMKDQIVKLDSFVSNSKELSDRFTKEFSKFLISQGFVLKDKLLKSVPIAFINSKRLDCYYNDSKRETVCIKTNQSQSAIFVVSRLSKNNSELFSTMIKISKKLSLKKLHDTNPQIISLKAFGRCFKGTMHSYLNADYKNPHLENIVLTVANSSFASPTHKYWLEGLCISPSISKKIKVELKSNSSKTITVPVYLCYSVFKKDKILTKAISNNRVVNYVVTINQGRR